MKVWLRREIANLESDPNGLHPMEAAFVAIARDGQQGTYEFDLAEAAAQRRKAGDSVLTERVIVTVEYPDLAEAAAL